MIISIAVLVALTIAVAAFVLAPRLTEERIVYDVTPDRQPVIGPVEGHDGLVVAAGLNGRGLMMAPTMARSSP